ncbi:MAG: DUF2510 domain-containing protein [Pseudolysinimonas sp.]
MAKPLPIAGWYPDPEISGHDRWWDGAGWTDNRRVTGDAAAQPPVSVAAAATGPSRTRGPGLYIPGETALQAAPAPAYAPAPVVRNNLALIGFILSLSGFILPVVVNSFAGGIVSIIGLRRSKNLAGTGILSNGRGMSIAGILIGFIWGGVCLLFIAGLILFEVWIFGVTSNFQYPDSPVM